MATHNVFLQGVFTVKGHGLESAPPTEPPLTHTVLAGETCQAVYFRGGNTSDELVLATLYKDGSPMRLFPIGAKSSVHVPLRVVEDVFGDSVLEVRLAAPEGVEGQVVVDLGLVEF